MTEDGGAPGLSVILPTDTWETIRAVVECYRRQTAADRIELILLTPAPGAVTAAMGEAVGFARVRVLQVAAPLSLSAARAVGVRAASAPLVFVGETHSFPHPGMVEALLRAGAPSWGVIVPTFGNRNPGGALSWAGFLSDYGKWTEGQSGGETDRIPLYNAAFRRSLLLDFGDRLDHILEHGDELIVGLRARGVRAALQPEARIDHLNVARPIPWLRERFLSGRMIGASRGARWSWTRRLLYVLGSPLIPAVLLARILPGVRDTARRIRLPAGTVAAIGLGMVVKAAGEMVGYAGGAGPGTERRMTEYELHKVAYAGDAPRWDDSAAPARR